MLLKHLVKVSSIFNALKGYPVLSIVYENYAPKKPYASKMFSVVDALMAENCFFLIFFDRIFFERFYFWNRSKFLCMHQHYFFRQQMFRNQLRAFLLPIEVPESSFPFSKNFLLTKSLTSFTSKKWTFQHVEWSNDCSFIFTHKIAQAFKLMNQTQISPNFH